MGRLKYEIRSKVKGKLVPIYLNYQDTNNHFRIKTEFKANQEYWNLVKEIKSGERLHDKHRVHEPILYGHNDQRHRPLNLTLLALAFLIGNESF
jgi:hypothetical protein